MPTTKAGQRGRGEKNKKGRLAEKASSFHGRSNEMVRKLPRPTTWPDLPPIGGVAGNSLEAPRKLTKLLLNVTIQRSLGAVQVLMSPESTVGDLIAAALRQYSKEGRCQIFPSLHPSAFDLHYSQFSLESLDTREKLMELGSRNFFLCPKTRATLTTGEDGGAAPPLSSSCSGQAKKASKSGPPWLKFINFLL